MLCLPVYQEKVVALAVDEAYCIVMWCVTEFSSISMYYGGWPTHAQWTDSADEHSSLALPKAALYTVARSVPHDLNQSLIVCTCFVA